jgi:hypothetical protein
MERFGVNYQLPAAELSRYPRETEFSPAFQGREDVAKPIAPRS